MKLGDLGAQDLSEKPVIGRHPPTHPAPFNNHLVPARGAPLFGLSCLLVCLSKVTEPNSFNHGRTVPSGTF